jgi:dihydrofolate synthase/folylpolyglutamate synthase
MNYQQTLDYIYGFLVPLRSPDRPPLSLSMPRAQALLAALNHPEQMFPSLIITGTKGKGSTAALVESMLRQAGYRTGLWTSPHLHTYRERIQVNRQLISRDELVELVTDLRPVFDQFDTTTWGRPNTFEIGFMLAVSYFARQSIDIAVLEVGLGGRYDVANVLTPLVSVITSISYDHMDVLGDTLAQIAWEKAGIIKPGVPVLTVPQAAEAMPVLRQVAVEQGAPLVVVAASQSPETALCLPSWSPSHTDLQVFDPFTSYTGSQQTALQGAFQRDNARLAVGVALQLRAAGLTLPDDAIERGLATTHWPGRCEIVPSVPPIVLDGAHNGDSAQRLIAALQVLYPGRALVLVLGTSHDKDLDRMLAVLVPAARQIVLTASHHPRAFNDFAAFAQLVAVHQNLQHPAAITVAAEVADALAKARALAQPNDLISVTGSLFVVAAAREALGLANERD